MMKNRLLNLVRAHQRNPVLRIMARAAKRFVLAYERDTWDMNVNGERQLLRSLQLEAGANVFDVGANRGDWTAMVLDLYPSAQVHCFEIDSDIRAELRQRFKGRNVLIHDCGLLDTERAAHFNKYSPSESVHNSLVGRYQKERHAIATATCQVVTDDFVGEENEIDRIHLLKIDVEGWDYEVIAGFDRYLSDQRIDVIQWEHWGGRYLRDFGDLFARNGYLCGKLRRTHVEICEYDNILELGVGPNYVAVSEVRKEVLSRIVHGWCA